MVQKCKINFEPCEEINKNVLSLDFEREDKDILNRIIKELKDRALINESIYEQEFGGLSYNEIYKKIFGSFNRQQFLKECGVK